MAEREFIAKFTANTTGLINGARQSEQALSKLGAAAEKSFGKLTGPILDLVTGAGILVAAKQVSRLEEAVLRTGTASRMSLAQMAQYTDTIFRVGLQTGISTDQLTELGRAAATASKDPKFLTENLATMAKVMQVTGASGQELGSALGKIHVATGLTGKAFENFVGTLTTFGQQKGVAQGFEQILPSVPRLLQIVKAEYPQASMEQIQDILMQGMFVGSPQALARGYARLARTGIPMLRRLGMDVSKGIPSIMEIITRIKGTGLSHAGQLDLLGKLFGDPTRFAKLLDNYSALAAAQKAATPELFTTEAERQAKTFESAMNRIKTAGLDIAQKILPKYMEKFSEWIEKAANSPNLDKYIGALARIVELMGSLWALSKAVGALKGGLGFLKEAQTLVGAGAGGTKNMGPAGLVRGSSPANPLYVTMVGAGNVPGGLGVPGTPGGRVGLGGKILMGGDMLATGYAIGAVLNIGLETFLPQLTGGLEDVLAKVMGGKTAKDWSRENKELEERRVAAMTDEQKKAWMQSRIAGADPNYKIENKIDVHNQIDGQDVAGKVTRIVTRARTGNQMRVIEV